MIYHEKPLICKFIVKQAWICVKNMVNDYRIGISEDCPISYIQMLLLGYKGWTERKQKWATYICAPY